MEVLILLAPFAVSVLTYAYMYSGEETSLNSSIYGMNEFRNYYTVDAYLREA